jgi:hypothetical protein
VRALQFSDDDRKFGCRVLNKAGKTLHERLNTSGFDSDSLGLRDRVWKARLRLGQILLCSLTLSCSRPLYILWAAQKKLLDMLTDHHAPCRVRQVSALPSESTCFVRRLKALRASDTIQLPAS